MRFMAVQQQVFAQGSALIIGVGGNLPCTLTDAAHLGNLLKDPARCAYPPAQVTVLTGASADRDGILAALDALAGASSEESTVVFYFSGHGLMNGNASYLIPNGWMMGMPLELAVSGAEFSAKLEAIPAAKKVILLDCCHAGGVGGIKGGAPAPVPPEALALFRKGQGYVLIASSRADEYSYSGTPYSVFTGALMEALCGAGVAGKDGYVRVADLAGHTRERVPRLTGNKQHPVLHFERADNFVMAYYAGGRTQPKSLPFRLQPVAPEDPSPLSVIKDVEALFVQARFEQAYARFHQLCVNDPDFGMPAAMILSRYREFQNKVMLGLLEHGEQHKAQLEIAHAFQLCLQRFKQERQENPMGWVPNE